jgi:RNA recognition motif-containing protein
MFDSFDRRNNFASIPVEVTSKEYGFESNLIYITRLPHHSEPSYIKSLFGSDENIEEIYAPEESRGNAWVEFKTPDDALAAVSKYDGYHFGPNSQKISVDLALHDQSSAGKEFIMRYTDFVRNKDLVPATSTVFVSNLPNSGPKSNIYQMVEAIGMELPGQYDDNMPHGIKHDRCEVGGVYVQFECIEDAQHFRTSFNGDYWKNNTLHVDFVDDAEIEVYLKPSTGTAIGAATAKQNVKLFVANTQGITADQIRNAVAPIVLNDANVCGGFAFVFLAADDAVTVIDNFSKGPRVKGNRYVYPKPPDKDKKDKKDAASFAAARARLAATPKPQISANPQIRAMSPPGPKQTLSSKADIPSLAKALPPKPTRKQTPKSTPAWLSEPASAPLSEPVATAALTPSSSPIEGIANQAENLNLAESGVRVKLNKLPVATTEADIRALFAGFQLEIELNKSFAFVWLASMAEAERAVTTLHKNFVHGKAINVSLAAK